MLKTQPITGNGHLVHDVPESEDDKIFSVGEEPSTISSLEFLPSDSTIDIYVPLNAASYTNLPIAVEILGIKNGRVVSKVITLEERGLQRRVTDAILTIAVKSKEECYNGPIMKAFAVSVRLSKENDPGKGCVKNVFELDYISFWSSFSICVRKPEMQGALLVEPHFLTIPIRCLLKIVEQTG